MLKFYLDKRIIAGCALALAILAWLAFQSYKNKQKVISGNVWLVHTLDVLYNTERLLSLAAGLELGQRGFTITGNEEFLNTYNKSREEILLHLQNLQILIKDNPSQLARTSQLDSAVRDLIDFSQRTVDQRKTDFANARTLNASMFGRRALERVRTLVYEIQEEENFLLKSRTVQNEQQVTNFNNAFIYLLVATTLILAGVFYAINITLKKRMETEHRLNGAIAEIKDLYDNAPCGYHSINAAGFFVNANNTLCRWLGYSKEEMIGKMKFADIIIDEDLSRFKDNFELFKKNGSVYDLEFRLKRRNGDSLPVILSAEAIMDEGGSYLKSRSVTIDNTERKRAEDKVKNLNHELEAFTYSVSHDLRAPLRSIDGYARILQEDYFETLDDEGKRILQVVMNNAKKMGKLIDDLLDFARLGRKDLNLTHVNMTNLVRGIMAELVEQTPGHKINVDIAPLESASVDVDMIRQVWVNLISNAIKYSGKKAVSEIVIRSEAHDGEICYSIQDNGVGFSMQYSPKLFGVFQRLHKIQDFPGTGVGLAIVKRIIDRHNGRVWADAKVDEGATFYFTIPKEHGK